MDQGLLFLVVFGVLDLVALFVNLRWDRDD